MKKSRWKKIVTCFSVLVTMISCFYTVSLMSNENIVKAMEQEREDILMLAEAYKWIDKEDIDPKTGKLKEGVIYNIGENGRAYTSEGFKNFEFLDANSNITPLTEYRTGGEIAYINYVQDRNEILFSNNFMVDFDITYDETNLNIEKKKYDLVKTEYTQSSHKEKRHRLVMRSKRVKVGWFKITLWYPAIEEYQETVIVTTPHNTYNEVVQHVGSLSLEEDANVLTKLTANAVDKYFPSVRTMSNEYGIPLLIMFMDIAVKTVSTVIRQILSMVADFIPVLDEIKTAFETVKGYDMFTGENVGTFWRIFGAITLAVSLVVSFVSFGAGGVAVDAAADAAQFAKKSAKLANKAGDVADTGKTIAKKLDDVADLKGFGAIKGKKLKMLSSADNKAKLSKLIENGADTQQLGKVLEKAGSTKKAENILNTLSKNADNMKGLSSKGMDLAIRNASIYDDLLSQGKDVNKIFDNLGNVKLNKADDLLDSADNLKGKVYKVDGDFSDLNSLDATTRGTLLDDAFGNSVNDMTVNGKKVFEFSDGSKMVSTPLGGSAKGCDNLVEVVDSNGNVISKNLTSRKSMDASKYNQTSLNNTLDEYFDTLSDYEFEYKHAQRVGETGLPKNMEFGEDYDKLVLELDVLNCDDSFLAKVSDYMKNRFGNDGVYDIIVKVVD